MTKHTFKVFSILTLGVIFFLLPLFSNPNYFLSRQNDLTEFFWPLISYSKNQIIENKTIPLWNDLWFGGMPLVADPQAPILYPFNILFLILPISVGFIASISLHLIFAGVFFYLFLRKLKCTEISALTGALLFISTPRYASYLEAGHIGLTNAWTWIAILLFLAQSISRQRVHLKLIFFSLALAFLYVSHSITAIICIPFVALSGYLTSVNKRQYTIAIILAGALTALVLSPIIIIQFKWQTETTRQLLTANPETYPIWNSKKDFVSHLIDDFSLISDKSHSTEKTIGVGAIVTFIAFMQGLSLKRRYQIGLFILFVSTSLISLNNASPIYSIIKNSDLLALIRVTTRFWVIFIILIIILFSTYISKVNRTMALFLAIIGISSSFILSWKILSTKPKIGGKVPISVHEYLVHNPKGRVWCVSHCLSQKDASLNKIQKIDGYATLQQTNFYQKSWSLFGGYWDYYSLAIPPFGAESLQTLNPDYELLGKYNVGYIISSSTISDPSLRLSKKIDSYYVYENLEYLPRVYFLDETRNISFKPDYIQKSANELRIFNNNSYSGSLVLAITYNKDWYAYTNREEKLQLHQSPEGLIEVSVPINTNYIIVKYEPFQNLFP